MAMNMEKEEKQYFEQVITFLQNAFVAECLEVINEDCKCKGLVTKTPIFKMKTQKGKEFIILYGTSDLIKFVE